MSVEEEFQGYLFEVTEQVCGYGPGQGPCPGCEDCGIEERLAQWDLVRRHAAHVPHKERVPVAALIQAYETATGTCIGCD